MSATELVADVVDRLGATANARVVYGEPVTEGNRTVVPVARVAYGFGGGFGTGDGVDESAVEPTGEQSRSGGLGGGVAATPVGALEITVDGTRFVRFRRSGWAVVFVVGMVVGWLLGRR